VVQLQISNAEANTNMTTTNASTNTSASTNTIPSNFIALNVSYQLIETLAPVVVVIQRNDRDLADQIRRAATSISLNLAEGQRSIKGNRHKHYAIAHGSANEVKAALFVAKAWGWIDASDRALAIMDRLLALLWKLTHSAA
jgi:four helix bundle protein